MGLRKGEWREWKGVGEIERLRDWERGGEIEGRCCLKRRFGRAGRRSDRFLSGEIVFRDIIDSYEKNFARDTSLLDAWVCEPLYFQA
jgi:hypothetical protein